MKKKLFVLMAIVIAAGVMIYPSFSASGATKGLKLCGQVIIPAVFPYMVLSSWLVGSNTFSGAGKKLRRPLRFVFNMPSSAFTPLLTGWLCGYPAGIRAAAEEYESGRLTKKQAERLICFCACVSPQFAISALGSAMLKNSYAGLCIYLGSLLSCVTVGIVSGICSRFKEKELSKSDCIYSEEKGFFQGVVSGSESMLRICGLTVFFAALTEIAEGSGLISKMGSSLSGWLKGTGEGFWNATFRIIIEMTGGAVAASGISGGFMICAAGAGFGGLCVVCQCISLSRTSGRKLNTAPMVVSRVVHGALTALFASLLLGLDKRSVSVFSAGSIGEKSVLGVDNLPAAIVMLLTAAVIILKGAAERNSRKV